MQNKIKYDNTKDIIEYFLVKTDINYYRDGSGYFISG